MGIVLKNVEKKYVKENTQENIVLKNISIKIDDGEIVALKGKSGVGKSTLLHIIGLLDTMTEGFYELDGEDISSIDNSKMAVIRNENIGFVLQDFGLIEEETTIYNVELPMMFGKMSLSKVRNQARQKLRELGISHLANQKVALLSGGEKQRVAIARALVNDPKYILADEPTGALDTKTASEIMSLLCELNKKGKTIIIVTHDDRVSECCKRVLVMVDGEIKEETLV